VVRWRFWRGCSGRELELVALEHGWKCQRKIPGGFWWKNKACSDGGEKWEDFDLPAIVFSHCYCWL